LIIKDSPQAGIDFIIEHPQTVLFVIVYVDNVERGVRFLELIKRSNATRDIPGLFIDGVADTGKLKMFEGGADGFLQKPIDMMVLLTIMARLGYGSTFSKNVQGIVLTEK